MNRLCALFTLIAASLFSADAEIVRHQLRVTNLPPPGRVTSRVQKEELQVTELRLENGMRVVILPTDHVEDEILFEMYALGGFGNLDNKEWAAGRIAALAAWESGLSQISKPELQDLLCRESIEMKLKVQLAGRKIEGNTDEDGLKTTFKLIHLIFTDLQVKDQGLQKTLASSTDVLRLRTRNPETHFEDVARSINSGDYFALKPISAEDLANVNPKVTKDFFDDCFGNPGDFTLILVGDLEVERVQELCRRYLANIPTSSRSFDKQTKLDLLFPAQRVSHKIYHQTESEDVTRFTYQLDVSMQEDHWSELDGLTQAVETRIRQKIIDRFGSSLGLDVAYEFPLYPDPSQCWMTIQFRSETRLTPTIIELVTRELQTLIAEGPTDEEWLSVKRVLRDNDLFWKSDNYFWLAMLGNYYKWDWPTKGLANRAQDVQELRADHIHQLLRQMLETRRYSVVTMQDRGQIIAAKKK